MTVDVNQGLNITSVNNSKVSKPQQYRYQTKLVKTICTTNFSFNKIIVTCAVRHHPFETTDHSLQYNLTEKNIKRKQLSLRLSNSIISNQLKINLRLTTHFRLKTTTQDKSNATAILDNVREFQNMQNVVGYIPVKRDITAYLENKNPLDNNRDTVDTIRKISLRAKILCFEATYSQSHEPPKT